MKLHRMLGLDPIQQMSLRISFIRDNRIANSDQKLKGIFMIIMAALKIRFY